MTQIECFGKRVIFLFNEELVGGHKKPKTLRKYGDQSEKSF